MGSQLSAEPDAVPDALETETCARFYSYKRSAPDAPPNPVPFSRSSVTPEVLRWLKNCEIFKASEAQLQTEDSGFKRCVDYPQLPGHVYYEGYFHGLHGEDGPVTSMNPRTGESMEKPAAPIELRAFIEAMRRANVPNLVDALRGATAEAKADNKLVAKVLQLIEKGRIFADIAVQIHAGQAVETRDVGWHTDGPNSILHAALSIAGSRALHSRRHADADPATPEETVVESMLPGDCYVSSPAVFAHGVSYGQAYRWSKRTIACQARFLFDDLGDVGEFFQPVWDAEDDWPVLMEALSKGLTGQPLVLPELSDVLGIMDELERAGGRGGGEVPLPPPPPPPPPVTTHAGSTPAAALKKKARRGWKLHLPMS